MRSYLSAAAIVLALLISCAPTAQEPAAPPPDTAKIRELGEARMTAIETGNVDGYLDAYADDAVWMPPAAEEIMGKAAARQIMQGALDEITIDEETTVDEQVVLSPDWVLDRGTYALTRTPKDGGESEEAVGTFLTIWHRQDDGSWKIAYDIWNSDRPMAREQK